MEIPRLMIDVKFIRVVCSFSFQQGLSEKIWVTVQSPKKGRPKYPITASPISMAHKCALSERDTISGSAQGVQILQRG